MSIRRVIPAATNGDYVIEVNKGSIVSFLIDNPGANSIIVKAQLIRADEIANDDKWSGSAFAAGVPASTSTTIADSMTGAISALIINFAAPSTGVVTVDVLERS